MRRKFTRE